MFLCVDAFILAISYTRIHYSNAHISTSTPPPLGNVSRVPHVAPVKHQATKNETHVEMSKERTERNLRNSNM